METGSEESEEDEDGSRDEDDGPDATDHGFITFVSQPLYFYIQGGTDGTYRWIL